MSTSPVSKSSNREKWSWYFYDFGNSGYAAVVLLAVYSAYFEGAVVSGPGVQPGDGTLLWSRAVSIAMLVVAVTAPFLGAIADYAGAKKKFLAFFTGLSVIFTAMLFFVRPGTIFIGMLFFILAEIGYRGAQVFYNSLLPDIAHQDEMAKISGNGWAFGSLGGIICLLIVLAFILLVGGELVTRISFLITAVFFGASTLPLFLWLRERSEPQKLPEDKNFLTVAVDRLKITFAAVRNYREFIKFMISFLIYNDGIIMALNFAAIFGAIMFGMEQQQLIIFMIIVQVASVAGAWLFGLVADKFDAKLGIMISLVIMTVLVTWIVFSRTLTEFFIIGALAGFALTGVQSVSRTMVGLMAPEDKSAEFYSFQAVAGRSSSFIGPFVYGTVAAFAARRALAGGMTAVAAEMLSQRVAMASIAVFLVVGMGLLLTVNEAHGRIMARSGMSTDPATAGK